MIVSIDFLQSADHALKWETPPRHYRSKKEKEIIYVTSCMDVRATFTSASMWKKSSQVLNPGGKVFPVGRGTRGCHGVSASQDCCLEKCHGVIKCFKKESRLIIGRITSVNITPKCD